MSEVVVGLVVAGALLWGIVRWRRLKREAARVADACGRCQRRRRKR